MGLAPIYQHGVRDALLLLKEQGKTILICFPMGQPPCVEVKLTEGSVISQLKNAIIFI